MLKIEDVITVVFLCSDFIAYSFRANRIYMLLVMIRKKKNTLCKNGKEHKSILQRLKISMLFLRVNP